MRSVHATIERNEMRQAERDRRDATQLEWQQVTEPLLFLGAFEVCHDCLSKLGVMRLFLLFTFVLFLYINVFHFGRSVE